MPTKPNRPKLTMLKPRLATLESGISNLERGPAKWGSLGRLSAAERGYGTAWKKLRTQILARDGYQCRCPDCKRTGRIVPADEVHHVISKAQWQADRGTLDGVDHPSNLLAVSKACHAAITAREAAGFR